MISRNLPNFLLKTLMNFFLLIYLFFSTLFHVDFEPKEKFDDSYTKFNSFDDPLILNQIILIIRSFWLKLKKTVNQKPTYHYPFCDYALFKEKERKNFTKYKFRNDDCSKWKNEHKRYRYRAYDFDVKNL